MLNVYDKHDAASEIEDLIQVFISYNETSLRRVS